MDYQSVSAVLRSTDDFFKNLALMYEDLVALIRERLEKQKVDNLLGPEGPTYTRWGSQNSEGSHRWIFNADDSIRFIALFVKVNDDYVFRKPQEEFKSICKFLGRTDIRFPLLIGYGTFMPRCDFSSLDANARRNWILQSVLRVEVKPENGFVGSPPPANFKEEFLIGTALGTGTWHCEQARVVLEDALEISDTDKLSGLADRILAIKT